MIELKKNTLIFRFPEVHSDAVCQIGFQRTLRIPDDNNSYPLPPGLGGFHLEHVEDHAEKVSDTMIKRGGIMLPMHQSEAMWMYFPPRSEGYPFAIKIAAGKINAITGDSWSETLDSDKQDYVVIPRQPWIDGFCVDEGLIRQFVAMPLGEGYSVEEQITGSSEFGGLQIIAFPMKKSFYDEMQRKKQAEVFEERILYCRAGVEEDADTMGLAPGGLMHQQIYDDEYGAEAWDTENTSRCFIHIINSKQWGKITSQPIPIPPPTAKDYSRAGLPWFEYYNDSKKSVKGSKILSQLDSLATKMFKSGKGQLGDNKSVEIPKIIDVSPKKPEVKDGSW
ncbi:hypothetical protein FHR99_002449 [Litorivivens lipolytica]|uniref:Uncharacterized protein n=1 Tax=Litorivivens lipolytica TaxID=1524264 RepID=A0A7W4W675_9GAMM|nr:hypothetical protein [Litorivivens lipolytica]MBB3048175.1 hypothetical protein [Litorivivens lipolytica]